MKKAPPTLSINDTTFRLFMDEKKSAEKTREFADLLFHLPEISENASKKSCETLTARLKKLASLKSVDRNAALSLAPISRAPNEQDNSNDVLASIPLIHIAARQAPFSVFQTLATQADTDIDANVLIANTLTFLCLAPTTRERIATYPLLANDTPHNETRRVFHHLLSRPETDVTRQVFLRPKNQKKSPRDKSHIGGPMDILGENHQDKDLTIFVEQLLTQRQTFVLAHNLPDLQETFAAIQSAVNQAKDLRINPRFITLVTKALSEDAHAHCQDLEHIASRPFPSSEESRILDGTLLASKPFSPQERRQACALFAQSAIAATFHRLEKTPRFPQHTFTVLRNKALKAAPQRPQEILIHA